MSVEFDVRVGDRIHWRGPYSWRASPAVVDRAEGNTSEGIVYVCGETRVKQADVTQIERREAIEGLKVGMGGWRTIWQRNGDLPVIDGLVARYDARGGAGSDWIESDLRSTDEPEIEFGDRVWFDAGGYGYSEPITVDSIIKTGRLWGDTESGKRVGIHRSSVVKVERRREVRDRWGEVIAESDWLTVWQRDQCEWTMQGGWDRDGVGPGCAIESDEFKPGDRVVWDTHVGVLDQGTGVVLRQNGRDVVVARNGDGSHVIVPASALWKWVPMIGDALRRSHGEPERPRTYDDVARDVREIAGPWLNRPMRSIEVSGLVASVESICGVKSARFGDDQTFVWLPDTTVLGELKCTCGEHKISPWDCHFPPTDMPRFRCVAPDVVGAGRSSEVREWDVAMARMDALKQSMSTMFDMPKLDVVDDGAPPALYLCARISPEGEGVDRHHRARWVDFEEVTNDERRAMVARLLPLEAVAEKPEHAVHKLLKASRITAGDVRGPEDEWAQWAAPTPIRAEWLDTNSRDGERVDPEFDIEVTL